uniref:Probetacellulin n=1 Tax=Bos taurus TaxID=9913 RepID=A0A3Q1MB19_BOVIN
LQRIFPNPGIEPRSPTLWVSCLFWFCFELEGLVILHCVLADGNSTRSPEDDGLLCGDHAENCPATTTQPKRRGHFSRCPKQYKHYCIKGRCRFVVAEQTPSCVCDEGYAGARCERVDLFYLRGDRGQILVICLIAVMVIFIILVSKNFYLSFPIFFPSFPPSYITPINDDIQETSIA